MNAAARELTLDRLARFRANTATVLAKLDAEAAQMDALADRLRDDDDAPGAERGDA